MSNGVGKPTIQKVLWHQGRLWMAGAWEAGVSATTGKSLRNERWHLWTWSPVEGWEAIAYFHSAKGGAGPDGKIEDFLFLPDGRLVVGGSFTRLDNPGGVMYHRVNAVGIYDPKEPTANKWKPLGTFQYNGTVSAGGSVTALGYDPKGNYLYIGGTFAGIRASTRKYPGGYSPRVHRVNLATGGYEGMPPGMMGAKPKVLVIKADTRTTPTTMYFGGKFHYTGGSGDGKSPMIGGDANWSTGFASWQDGSGWTTYPKNFARLVATDGGKEGCLQRAGDFIAFDSVWVRDLLLDGDDIWIVGAFSQGKRNNGKPLRGIARYDRAKDMWVDPTGMGGVGRDVFNVAKGKNGKIYFSGAFGGVKAGKFFDGFKDGTSAHLAISYDPSSGKWEQLGSGLISRTFPEVRMALHGDDVYFVGDFDGVLPESGTITPRTKPAIPSSYIARWNETIDFSTDPDGSKSQPSMAAPLPVSPPEISWSTGNEHWSRNFARPPRSRAGKTQQNAHTGMDDGQGAPSQINGMGWHGDTLYFVGNWPVQTDQTWHVWTYHAEKGWNRLGWEGKGGTGEGPMSPPAGMAWHDDKLYVFGAISKFAGIGYWDPADKQWHQVKGTYKGKAVEGNAVPQRGGPVNDVVWAKNGDMYLAGSTGLGADAYNETPWMAGQVIRIDSSGEYHPVGKALMAENPNKPSLGFYTILLDESKSPPDIFLGGTFCFYGGPPTSHARMTYNVARFDQAKQDWAPLGKGFMRWYSLHDKKYYPEGLHGLPAHPGDDFSGFLAAGFPRVRDLVQDKQGNLYACGTLSLLDDSLPTDKKQDSIGVARYEAASDTWVPIGSFAGFSRDPVQMSWIDDDTLLISGGMDYSEMWEPINGVCTLNVRTGEMKPLGGGLMKFSRSQVIAPMVVHAIRGDEFWFGGYFQRAGINDNSRVGAPIVSQYVAMWNGKANLDPNRGLVVEAPEPVCAVTGYASKSVDVTLKASGISPSEGKILWFDRSTSGKFRPKGKGNSFKAKVRVKAGVKGFTYYVSVKRKDGSEGGKRPVHIGVKACN
jgi:hypothetical protein